MSMKLQGYKSGNASAPIYQPSAATLAFAALDGRLAWLEGDEGALISNGKWYDRMTGIGFTVSGTLTGGADTNTTGSGVVRGGAVFSGQTVDLGAIFPTNADYSIFAVYRQSADTSQTVHGILGGSAASWHSFHLSPTSGILNLSHATVPQYTGLVNHAPGSVYRAGAVWVESPKSRSVYFNGSPDTGTRPAADSNTDSSAIVGNIPGLGGARRFMGTLFHLSLWSRALTGADLTAVNAYLAEQYG